MYLKSLDGVRCIAIMAVLIFHVYEPLLPGGFLGVDLFFLISGFIITRNIDGQVAKGRFSLKDFYLKRIARLLPAASFVIALTLLASVWLVPQEMRANFAQGGIYAALSVVNFFFAATAGYFDESSASNPFLHYWSLSVEEQFYIFWPMLLLLALKLKRSLLPFFFAGLAILSAIVTWAWSVHDANDVFFLMPFRVFQFAAGACCGLVFDRLKGWKADISTLVGLITFVASMFLVSGEHFEFVTVSLIPTLGSVLILLGIQGSLSQPVLANPVFRFIGLRAYSIYLVHWPIIVFARLNGYLGDDPIVFASLSAASILLGAALNIAVETPFRVTAKDSESGQRLKPALSLGVVIAAVTIGAHVWAYAEKAQSSRTSGGSDLTVYAPGQIRNNLDADGKPLRPDFELEKADRFTRTGGGPSEETSCVILAERGEASFNNEWCLRPGTEADILVIGSSHTRGTFMALGSIFGENRVAIAGGGGCSFLYGSAEDRQCDAWNEVRATYVNDPQYKYIAIPMWGRSWREDEIDAWRKTLDELAEVGKPVVILLPRYMLKGDQHLKASRNLDLNFRFQDELLPMLGDGLEDIVAYGEQYDNITFIDPNESYCNEDGCRAFDDYGNIIYADRSHFTYWGALLLAEGIRDQVVEAFGAQ